MESGSSGNNRGIRIYVEDISLNGTYINNKAVGRRKRVVLKHNDKIQLCKREQATHYDPDYARKIQCLFVKI
jgi:pSer/pThr/pTyr-binding forkhead associated (FHA) protein